MADYPPNLPVPQPPEELESAGHVILPVGEAQFRDFITSLLGRPQSINKALNGHFELTRDDVRDLYSLIDQRVTQQNQGLLAKFEATIEFSDNSAVTLKSLEDLLRYNEPRALVSRALHMTWDYIVRFPDKTGPERQKIHVSFIQGSESFDSEFLFWGPRVFFSDRGQVAFRIEHTARTWGADIEALLTGFAERIIAKLKPWQRLLKEYGGWITGAIGAVALLLLVVSVVIAVNQFDAQQGKEAEAFMTSLGANDDSALNSKLDKLVTMSFSPAWPPFLAKLTAVIFGIVVVGAALLIWVGTIMDRRLPGFILLTKQAEQERDAYRTKERNRLFWFLLAATANIGNGLFANLLFARFVS